MISLSLTYALPIASILNGLLTSSAETEQELVAVERTLRYTDHVPAEVCRVPDRSLLLTGIPRAAGALA